MSYNIYSNIRSYCSNEKKRYSAWIYDGSQILQVYDEEMPNTVEVWFQFYTFSYLYWKLLQEQCIDNIKGKSFFNSFKIKEFLISYLLCGTNIPGIIFQRQKNGKLTQKSLNTIFSIHPRILRVILEKVDLFPKEQDSEEEMEIEKQCLKLFGKGESVSNPHPIILTYCNLVTFWDKLGLNYFDLMKLPYDTFNFLRKIAAMDNDFHAQSLKSK